MKKILLCILDGLGISDNTNGNAFCNAKTPNLDFLMKKYSYKRIHASGKYVGLPDNQNGNSEVGHLTIGSGRIINQPLTRINKSISNGSFYDNLVIIEAINHAKKNDSNLQIIGLLSDGGVHSHINHFIAVLEICKKMNFKNVFFHILTDGRDTYYNVSKKYINILSKKMKEYSIGKISTISGRYYGMDRDNRWDRIEKYYNSIVFNKGEHFNDYNDLINYNYNNNIFDEFIEPGIINENGMINDNDSIIWLNFRPDRSKEILSALSDSEFDKFKIKRLKNIYLATMMWVNDNIKSKLIFDSLDIDNTIGIVLDNNNLKQLRIAETEKYAHVTYFFDGLKELKLKNCKKILIPSSKVPTYDLEPKMSAKKITDTLLTEMDNNYDFILVNYANADMVGHTGNYLATITAVEEIDKMIGKLYSKCIDDDYLLIITADHGNCEKMKDINNKIVTSHTNNLVPFIVCDKINNNVNSLCDIAPFILNLFNLEIPNEMK